MLQLLTNLIAITALGGTLAVVVLSVAKALISSAATTSKVDSSVVSDPVCKYCGTILAEDGVCNRCGAVKQP